MIGKTMSEEDLKGMFGPYGILEEVTVLRHPDGNGRGCGFIKFATREQAQAAINALNASTTIDGCSAPIVVKFADTEKDKMSKRMQVQCFFPSCEHELLIAPPASSLGPNFRTRLSRLTVT